MTHHKFLEMAAVIAAAHLVVVLMVAILPLPGNALMLDVLLAPIDIVWFPNHKTSIMEGGIVVLLDDVIWGATLTTLIAVRRNWKTRYPM